MKTIKEKIRAEVLEEVSHKHQVSMQCAREAERDRILGLIDEFKKKASWNMSGIIGQSITAELGDLVEELKARITGTEVNG